jgi:hypothetical protein
LYDPKLGIGQIQRLAKGHEEHEGKNNLRGENDDRELMPPMTLQIKLKEVCHGS